MKIDRKKIVISVIIALIGMITIYMAFFAPRKPTPTEVGNIVASEDNTPEPENQNQTKPEEPKKQEQTDADKLKSNAYKVAQMLSNGDYAYTPSSYDKLEKMANEHNIYLDDSCKIPFTYGEQAGYVSVASMNKESTYTESDNQLNVSNTIIHGIISSKEANGDDDTLKSIAIDSLENLDDQDSHTDVVNYVIDLSSDGASATIKCLNPEVFTK